MNKKNNAIIEVSEIQKTLQNVNTVDDQNDTELMKDNEHCVVSSCSLNLHLIVEAKSKLNSR